jgi:cytochrome c oxidase subunit 2
MSYHFGALSGSVSHSIQEPHPNSKSKVIHNASYRKNLFVRSATITTFTLASLPAWAEMKLNLVEPVSPLTKSVYDLHMITSWLAFWIMVVVIGLVGYAMIKFRKSKNYQADQTFHENSFGRWSWLLVPVIVLGIDLSIAGKASETFDQVEDIGTADVTVKVTGSQWKWTYDYIEDDVRLISSIKKKEEAGDEYLRSVDEPLVLPVNQRIRFLHTATDVLHAWWVPAIAVKKDSIPGYINETWTVIEREGLYTGQCAENCGTGHAYMPIQVAAVSTDAYQSWMAEKKSKKQAEIALASSDKVWTVEEMSAKGEEVYNTFCSACHQPGGEGMAPVFPAIKGSPIALGDIAAHLDIVINGKQGTAMSAWGAQLSDLQIAAVVTYERNAFGNNVGDVVQPSDIKAARK